MTLTTLAAGLSWYDKLVEKNSRRSIIQLASGF